MAVAAPTDTELDRDALWAWGVRYGAAARPPRVVTLAGDLGAGKTTLAQAICAGFGVTEVVTSPTFALVHEYASPRGEVLIEAVRGTQWPDDRLLAPFLGVFGTP